MCIHLKINVVPLAFTVYIVLQNVQFVHCALYKSYSLYKPCLRALKNKCSPFTVYIVMQSVQFVHCTAYNVKNRTVYIQYTPCLCTLKNKCSPFTVYIVVQNVQFVHYVL